MSNASALIARRSIRARLGRLIAIALAITAGVAFVVGSFVLADSLRSGFNTLFEDISENIDAEIRSSVAFDQTGQDGDVERDPFDASVADTIAAVEGITTVEPAVMRTALLIDDDGDIVGTPGAPSYGVSLEEPTLSGIVVKDGRLPSGADEVVVDQSTADGNDLSLGDDVTVQTDTGSHRFTIVGFVGVGDSPGFYGATLAAWDLATAQDVLGATGTYDTVDVAFAEGADPAAVTNAISASLPEGLEVVDRQTLIDESNDSVGAFIGPLGTGLLVFAFVTAFVSIFLINNVFAITIGQRLRELALLRAIGARGRQVRRLIYAEALAMSVVATAIGIVAGMGVARLLIGLFNAAGAGFPDIPLRLQPRTIVMALLVGVGFTMTAVIAPALRAARIPPVAAMRPELGFDAINSRRLIGGTVVTIVGAILFGLGIFARPGGTVGTIAAAGLGGVLVFVGVASLSSTVARPVTRVIGWPVAKLFGTPGKLAQQNAGRAPRRTSSSAAALMIGVALVSAAAVFASSIRTTFVGVLERGVLADVLVMPSNQGAGGLPPIVAETIAGLPEVAASTPVRGLSAQIDGDVKFLAAADPATLPELINLDVNQGGYDGLDDNGVMIFDDVAADLGLELGDAVAATFQNGTERDLTVVGTYGDASLAGNWVISLSTAAEVSGTVADDFFIPILLADGVDIDQAEAAIGAAIAAFPQAEVQSNAEFRQQLEGQINQLLAIISGLLGLAIVIAVLGISITMALGVFERTREIGLMRAVGMTRRQTRRTVRWEAVIVSTFGAVVGIVVGTLLGVAMSLAVPDDVIDQIAFSWATIVFILVGAVIAGLVAAVYPSYKASNLDVLEAIAAD
ncbi:MAG: ABC transporter permease [Desertimonas sp.]